MTSTQQIRTAMKCSGDRHLITAERELTDKQIQILRAAFKAAQAR